MFSWILAKLDKHFEKMLEESMQRTADRMNKEHEFAGGAMDKINDITKEYPIYDTTLRIGSYVATSLQTEIFNYFMHLRAKTICGF